MPKNKDYYQILQVSDTATFDEIRKAYYKLARKHAPDKGGKHEDMIQLNEAWEVLKDESRKGNYDMMRNSAADAIDRMRENNEFNDALDATGERFSEHFRKTYKEYMMNYKKSPCNKVGLYTPFEPYKSEMFDVSENYENPKSGSLFEYLIFREKRNFYPVSVLNVTRKKITPEYAVEIFIDFLEGDYYGTQLQSLKIYFTRGAENAPDREAELYKSIAQIIGVAYEAGEKNRVDIVEQSTHWFSALLGEFAEQPRSKPVYHSLKGITNYIKNTASFSMAYCAQLLQNEYFRDLYKWSLVNEGWCQQKASNISEQLGSYINDEKAREELEMVADRIATITDDIELQRGMEEWLKTNKYLYIFEKNAKEKIESKSAYKAAVHHREYAYQILDWFPILGGRVPVGILANLFLQAASHFQMAGNLERGPLAKIAKMASENIAFDCYVNALYLSQRSSLDVEFYIIQNILNNFSHFSYKIEGLDKLIPELQERFLFAANVFPVIEPPQPNVNFFMNPELGLQGMMRRLLHALIGIIKHNRHCAPEDQKRLDHDYVNVLYYAYEACLRQWYEDREDPQIESKIRATLMEELLAEKGWTFDDLDMNLQAPWVMVGRDDDGWLKPSRTIALPMSEECNAYCSLDAVIIDHNTGKLKFILRDIVGGQPPSNRVITFSDLRELLQHNIGGALLSLDEVNHHMRFHPFNKMRVAPASLFETDFMNTLFLTDYFLKFITVGHEVSGEYPYPMRPIDQMVSEMPFHLKQIIRNFHNAKKEESAHRFWIEAQPVNVFYPEHKEESFPETSQIVIPEIRMVVKKHLLRRNAKGELVDDENEPNEGWQIYFFGESSPTKTQVKALAKDHPIIVFAKDKRTFFFVPKGGEPEKQKLDNYNSYYLLRLEAFSAQPSGLIEKTNETSEFLFYITKMLCRQFKKPNHFSPEYIFAQEFTAHYDEFGVCLPEFARLRELSRVTVFVQLLNSINETNSTAIEKLNDMYRDHAHWQERKKTIENAIQEMEATYEEDFAAHISEILMKIRESVQEFNREWSLQAVTHKQREVLNELRPQIGTLSFTVNSREVIDTCEEMYQENRRRIIQEHGTASWNYNQSNIRNQCNAEKPNIARRFSQQKRSNTHSQLVELFSKTLSPKHSRSSISGYVHQFMDGNSTSLLNALAQTSHEKSLDGFVATFENVNRSIILMALNGNENALNSMARSIATANFSEVRKQVDRESRKVRAIPSNEKKELQSQITRLGYLKAELSNLGIGKKPDLDDENKLEGKCLWVPASVDSQPNRTRLVYGGVHIQPKINIERRHNYAAAQATHQCYDPSNHVELPSAYLPSATSGTRSNSFHMRAQQAAAVSSMPSASASAGGASGSGGGSSSGGGYSGGSSSGGGGRKPPGGRPPSPSRHNHINRLRMGNDLSFEAASSVFNENGKLKREIIEGARIVRDARELGNKEVRQVLKGLGGNYRDWGKYETKSINSPSGKFRIHFYYNPVTKDVYYGHDFKAVFNHQGTYADSLRGPRFEKK